MISVIHPAYPGVTMGIYSIIKAMQEYAENVVAIVKISKRNSDTTDSFTWIVLFREKGTIGQFVALVNQEGTNYGPQAGGEGCYGYCSMMSFIEDNDDLSSKLIEIEWDDIDPQIRGVLSDGTQKMYERYRAYEWLLIEHVLGDYRIFPPVEYRPNKKWQDSCERMRSK